MDIHVNGEESKEEKEERELEDLESDMVKLTIILKNKSIYS